MSGGLDVCLNWNQAAAWNNQQFSMPSQYPQAALSMPQNNPVLHGNGNLAPQDFNSMGQAQTVIQNRLQTMFDWGQQDGQPGYWPGGRSDYVSAPSALKRAFGEMSDVNFGELPSVPMLDQFFESSENNFSNPTLPLKNVVPAPLSPDDVSLYTDTKAKKQSNDNGKMSSATYLDPASYSKEVFCDANNMLKVMPNEFYPMWVLVRDNTHLEGAGGVDPGDSLFTARMINDHFFRTAQTERAEKDPPQTLFGPAFNDPWGFLQHFAYAGYILEQEMHTGTREIPHVQVTQRFGSARTPNWWIGQTPASTEGNTNFFGFTCTLRPKDVTYTGIPEGPRERMSILFDEDHGARVGLLTPQEMDWTHYRHYQIVPRTTSERSAFYKRQCVGSRLLPYWRVGITWDSMGAASEDMKKWIGAIENELGLNGPLATRSFVEREKLPIIDMHIPLRHGVAN